MENLLLGLRALGDANRLKIVMLLLEKDYCVGALANKLEISKAAVSQHMKVLRKNGMVKGEKRGYFTHYIVQQHHIRDISKQLGQIADKEFVMNTGTHPCRQKGICHEEGEHA